MHDRHVCLIDRTLADISTAPNDLGGGRHREAMRPRPRKHLEGASKGSPKTTALFSDRRWKDSASGAR
jgi:hypothetical protein